MGYSGKVLELFQMIASIQTTLAIQILYYILIACIKISICFCYLRIGMVQTSFIRLLANDSVSYGQILRSPGQGDHLSPRHLLRSMYHRLLDAMHSSPSNVEFHWAPLGNCINTTAFFYSTSSINIIVDIWLLGLPIQTLLKIQRPKREKFGLIFVFGLGILSLIFSIVRLHAIRIYTESTDPFYDSVAINLWSIIEFNIGIWCASIPSLRIILIRRAASHASRSAGTYKYHSSGRSGDKGLGNSASEASKNYESFDMGAVDLTNLQAPGKVVDGNSVWCGRGTEDQIHFPGVYNPTSKLPV